MKDANLYQLLADELTSRQRILPYGSLLCVPQSRSLLADQQLNIQDLYNHILIPSSGPNETGDKIAHFETLNGHYVEVDGSAIRTTNGFMEKRIIRILLSEEKTIHHQKVYFQAVPSIQSLTRDPDHSTTPKLPSSWRYFRPYGPR